MTTFRILVVEDEPLMANAMCRQLWRKDGSRIISSALSVAAAKEMLSDRDWHLVITDWSLGDGTGAEVIAAAEAAGLPVFVYSSLDRSGLCHVPCFMKPPDGLLLASINAAEDRFRAAKGKESDPWD